MVHLYHLLDSPVIYTAEMRGILENTPPEAICTPRPGRLPEGNLEGRGVQIAEGGIFSNLSRLKAVYCHSIFQSGSVLDITLQIAGVY